METEINDLLETYISDGRSHSSGSPWTMLNMISSKNGLSTFNGKSGPLGGEPDRALFRTLRGLADVILVAAGTVRIENYSFPVITDRTAQIRRSLKKPPLPTIVVVTNSMNLDPMSPLFNNPNYRTGIFTSTRTLEQEETEHFANTDFFHTGGEQVDLRKAIAVLAETYGPLILVEGGPRLNQQLVRLDLFDELCITISPISSPDVQSQEITTATSYQPGEMVLDRRMQVGEFIFERFLRIDPD